MSLTSCCNGLIYSIVWRVERCDHHCATSENAPDQFLRTNDIRDGTPS